VLDKLFATEPMPDLPATIRSIADRLVVAVNNPTSHGGQQGVRLFVQTEAGRLRVAADRLTAPRAGVDEHPEDRCERCGGKNIKPWFAPSPIWNEVVGYDFGILCPQCFTEIAEAKGVAPTGWRLAPEGYEGPDHDPERTAAGALPQGVDEQSFVIGYRMGVYACGEVPADLDECAKAAYQQTLSHRRALAMLAAAPAQAGEGDSHGL